MTNNISKKEYSFIPILDSSNFSEWHGRMTILLKSKELMEVCENQLEHGATTTATNKWNKLSSEAVNIISSRISPRMFLDAIKNGATKNSYLLWSKINEQYASKKPANRGQVWMKWVSLTFKGDLQEYIDNSKRAMLELETVNLIVQPEILTFTLLGKLSSDAKIKQFAEVLTLNEELIEQPDLVLSKLQDYCDNSSSQNENPISHSPSALVSESVHPYRILHYCANGKHNPNCTTHSKEECFAENPHLRPRCTNKKRAINNRDASAHLSTAQALVTGTTSRQEELIIDCGAMHHMFNSEAFFSSINKTPPMNVSTGDSGSSLRAKGVGTVTISCNNHLFTLNNCLFVPNLNCNLISLLELFNGKLLINRTSDQFTLESNSNKIISGKIQNNLMKVDYQIPKSYSTKLANNCWHLRLGHPSNQVIKSMGLPHSDSPCKSCDLSKMCKLPFDNQFEH
ncbi:hypothetical protein O181_075144, partial [Austropuccinia psidii MF-1]|nr:hypothetical protein [Austropuccinia psidii MF-1]